ncbi:MAG: hypothetical protein IPG72_03055 [Ardenticatenales bacterium]|nr:hypothetical protein [Ardenticatenales bacterium]
MGRTWNSTPITNDAAPASAGRSAAAAALAVGLALALIAPGRTPPAGRAAGDGPSSAGYTNFETEPVRPLALAADGRHLFALNTADDRLEVFRVAPDGLHPLAEIVVGLRPVAIALRGDQAWVVNHLSDAVSVVDVRDPAAPRVVHTLAVGDEPRDIVIAGPNHDRVFVAAAWRANLTKAGAGRAGVWIFDAKAPTLAPRTVQLFGQKPRALATGADGTRVYAAVFASGNRTSVVHENAVAERGVPLPTVISTTVLATPPPTGLMVKRTGSSWVDDVGGDWTANVPFNLPDKDVFVLDAAALQPTVLETWSTVGTMLFNMAVHPTSGEVWVANSDARNHTRFEPVLRGDTWSHRITRLAPRAAPVVANLNGHIDHGVSPGPDAERARTLAQPLDLVFAPDGRTAYVAAFQSAQVGVLDSVGNVVARIPVGFGPGGLALDAAGGRLYVLNHLALSISTVDTATRTVIATTPLAYDPTPAVIRAGRPLFYDAARTSGHGDMACSSCHVFGDLDSLAWDLGDPTGKVDAMPFGLTHPDARLKPRNFKFHPMKGAMVTQSFRGMAGAGPMHWRADRFADGPQPTNEHASFLKFRPAFQSLNGMAEPISEAEMDAFATFVLTIHYPPNPLQNLDRSRTAEQQAGFDLFTGDNKIDSGLTNCAGCHTMPLGTNKRVNFEGNRTNQDFKAPHLRNIYDKVGRFDVPGDQVSGFGFTHDGAVDTVAHFLEGDVFSFPGADGEAIAARQREVEAFVLAFDTGMAPAVGAQFTLRSAVEAIGNPRLTTVLQRAAAGDCDLVAHARVDGRERGWLSWQGQWYPDGAEPTTTFDDLVARAAPDRELTLLCTPPGDGPRSAVDRDLDGWRDGDERSAGTSPTDPASHPAGDPPPVPWRTIVPTTPSASPTSASPTSGTPATPTTPRPSATPGPTLGPTPRPTPVGILYLPKAELVRDHEGAP